jgi:hypothetical protein
VKEGEGSPGLGAARISLGEEEEKEEEESGMERRWVHEKKRRTGERTSCGGLAVGLGPGRKARNENAVWDDHSGVGEGGG